MIEEWRSVIGYEGLYEVSNTGRVRSLDRCVKYSNGQIHLYKGKILSPVIKDNGYLVVNLQRRTFYIHRLVTEAFIPNPDNLIEVNHKDEDKTNNSVDNLEWCDHKYNVNFGTRNIRAKETAVKNGYWSSLSRKEYRKKWYQENKDKINDRQRTYYQENRDRICEQKKEYYLKKKEMIQNNL